MDESLSMLASMVVVEYAIFMDESLSICLQLF